MDHFLLPYQIVTGGVTGIAAVIYYGTGYLSICLISHQCSLAACRAEDTGIQVHGEDHLCHHHALPILALAQDWMIGEDGKMVQILGEGQDFMSLIIGCLFTGLSLAIVFLHNGSTGGTDIIAAIVNKYHNISLGRVLIFVDLLIVGSSFFVFNAKPEFTTIDAVRKVVFGLCTMVIENLVLDYVMNAKRESVQFMIFSKKYQEIANAIGMQMDHGVTILDGHGWYTGNEMKVLCILAKKNESVTIFRIVKIIDPNAFVSQSSVIGVYGEGFDEMKVKIKDKDIKTIKS